MSLPVAWTPACFEKRLCCFETAMNKALFTTLISRPLRHRWQRGLAELDDRLHGDRRTQYWRRKVGGRTLISSRSVQPGKQRPGCFMGFADGQIVENRSRNQRHFRDTRVKPHAFVFEKASNAARGFESKRAAAGEYHGVNAFGYVERAEQIPFDGPRGRSANIAPGYGSGFAQDRCDAGKSVIIGGMANQDADDVGQALHGFMLASSINVN